MGGTKELGCDSDVRDMDGKGWGRIKERLPGGYEWAVQVARNRKGRTIGEMIMAIKKEMMEKGTEVEVRREGCVEGLGRGE